MNPDITTTKQKILECSRLIFNEEGLSNARLQQIADASGISVGNLAYHFKNKEAITDKLIDGLATDLKNIISFFGKDSLFLDMDKFFESFIHLSIENAYLIKWDSDLRKNFPEDYSKIEPLLYKLKLQINSRLQWWNEKGLLKDKIDIQHVGINIWLILCFYPYLNEIAKKGSDMAMALRKHVWSYIQTILSSKGLEKLYSQLGEEVLEISN